jgi:flagellar assembly protein FliH
MSKFTPEKFNIDKEGSTGADDLRVVKLEEHASQKVADFQPGALVEEGRGQYSQTRSKFGSLAMTDQDRSYRSQKDTRFSLSSLLRKPLSVEEEERRAIEEKVRARVSSMADEVRESAHASGYQAGLQKGYEEAFKRFQEEGAGRLARFEKVLEEAENAKQEIFRANERYLLELIFRIARTVLLREASTDRQLVLRLARELIDRVGIRENVRIRVNPDDGATIEMLKDGIEKTLGTMKNLTVEVSNQVKGGGCAVETEWNAIDASIETQLNGIYEALIGGSASA